MASRHPDRKACVNQFAVIDLAMNGPAPKVRTLRELTKLTLKRMRLRTKGVLPFTKTPRGGAGDFPCIQHVRFWLDDIQKTEQYADDIEFLKRLHVTLAQRQV